MSAICYCYHNDKRSIKKNDSGGEYCTRCNCWWAPEHGSHGIGQRPQPNLPSTTIKVGRNEPCPCRSGKKSKHCCNTKNWDGRQLVEGMR
jgi:hypothetical protein